MNNCPHLNFQGDLTVVRLLEDENSKDAPSDYRADVKIRCSDCGLPFVFIGVPVGLSFRYPTASPDMSELSIPIAPTNDPVEHVNTILKNNTQHE